MPSQGVVQLRMPPSTASILHGRGRCIGLDLLTSLQTNDGPRQSQLVLFEFRRFLKTLEPID